MVSYLRWDITDPLCFQQSHAALLCNVLIVGFKILRRGDAVIPENDGTSIVSFDPADVCVHAALGRHMVNDDVFRFKVRYLLDRRDPSAADPASDMCGIHMGADQLVR